MDSRWLILVISLPTHHATSRMRVWRALKALGCGVLRDGVYLLPDPARFRRAIQVHVDSIMAEGGVAYLLEFDCTDHALQKRFESLFDRSSEYARLLGSIQHLDRELQFADLIQLQRRIGRLRKELAEIANLDFFPGPARNQVVSALDEFEQNVLARVTPDEPRSIDRRLKRLKAEEYRHRVWATRRRPWVDRLACAWLIRRFIDPGARILWLNAPADCPAEALGFDFDGALFTHVGGKVSFEVLLASFGLTGDAALNRLGGLVHLLDIGGVPVAEAPGMEALIRGMHQRLADDDALLAEAEKVFDSFYLAFSGTDA